MSKLPYTCKICGDRAIGDRHVRDLVWPYVHDPLRDWDRRRPMWVRERDSFGASIAAREYHWVASLPKKLPPLMRVACGYTVSAYPLAALHEVGGHNICPECRKASVAVLGEWKPAWTRVEKPSQSD